LLNEPAMIHVILVAAAMCATACGTTAVPIDGAPPPVDAPLDGASPPVDANLTQPGDSIDLTTAAGRLTGGGMTLDVQLGHPMDQSRVTNGAMSMEGATPIHP
jgi:hypothetical protein